MFYYLSFINLIIFCVGSIGFLLCFEQYAFYSLLYFFTILILYAIIILSLGMPFAAIWLLIIYGGGVVMFIFFTLVIADTKTYNKINIKSVYYILTTELLLIIDFFIIALFQSLVINSFPIPTKTLALINLNQFYQTTNGLPLSSIFTLFNSFNSVVIYVAVTLYVIMVASVSILFYNN